MRVSLSIPSLDPFVAPQAGAAAKLLSAWPQWSLLSTDGMQADPAPAEISSKVTAVQLVTPAGREVDLAAADRAAQFAERWQISDLVLQFATPFRESPPAETLARLAQLADARKLTISVDVSAPRDTMRRRIEALGKLAHPRVKLAVHSGNYLIANPTSSVEVMLQRHIQDCGAIVLGDAPPDISGNRAEEQLPLGGDGLIDYARVFQVVNDVAFSGPVIFAVRGDAAYLDDAITHLRICGWLPRMPAR